MIRPIATEAERIRLIRDCQQSGLTANEWCRQNGISVQQAFFRVGVYP